MLGEQRMPRPAHAGAGEGRVERFERGALDRPDRGIVDEPRRRGRGDGGPQRAERGLERLVARQVGIENVDEDRIEEAAVGRMIGARPLPVVREQHVHRADAEIGRPRAARRLARERERREVADPLIPRAAQGVELRGDAEPLAQRRLGSIALGRRDGQRA